MASFVHEAFGAFQLSLDHVEVGVMQSAPVDSIYIYAYLWQGNAYKIKTYPKFGTFHVFLPQDMRVSFQTATELELPDPQLLKVHNAIAIFFHATGMGDELDLELEGKEDPVVANMVDPAIEGLEGRVNDWLVDVH